MVPDPTFARLKPVLSLFGRLAFAFLQRQIARRGAEQGLPNLWPELDEALDVLGGGEGAIARAIEGGKAWASDAPSAFREERFQRWTRDPQTRAALRLAAARHLQGFNVVEAERSAALARYASLASDAPQRAQRPFDDAVAFLVLSVQARQTAGDRVGVAIANANRNAVIEAVEEQGQRSDERTERLFGEHRRRTSAPTPCPVPARSPEELAAASADLLTWPQDIAGRVMARPELAFIEELLTAPSEDADPRRSVLLLGPPGSGKSALLAALGARLVERGATVIGIKADTLPPTIQAVADLGPALDLGSDLVAQIQALSDPGPVYVLIDQLDAVASLIDGSGGRLRALSGLVRRLRACPGVRVAASARPFELAADAAFRAAFPEDAVEAVDLEPPSREEVDRVLRASGIDPSEVPAGLDDIVRVPQALRDIVSARRAGCSWGAMTSWRRVQALRFDRLVEGHPDLDLQAVVEHMVDTLRSSGALRSPEGRLPLGSGRAVHRLCAEGILRRREETGSVEFAHQTWAETLDARLALAQGDLHGRVVAAGHNLLARPQALAMLRFVRDTAPDDYDVTIERLWDDAGLRRHLRHLVLDLAAGADVPTPIECRLVIGVVAGADAALSDRALRLTAGKPAWFPLLRGAVADRMSSADDGRAWSVARWLAQANSHADEMLDLVERHWRGRDTRAGFIPFALERLENWDERAFDLYRAAVAGSSKLEFLHAAVARRQATEGRHPVAARLLGIMVDQVVDAARRATEAAVREDNRAAPEVGDILAAAARRLRRAERRSFSHHLTDGLKSLPGLHDLPKFARLAPHTYASALVPRFAAFVHSADAQDHDDAHRREIREFDVAAGRRRDAPDTTFDIPLVEGLRVALDELARSDPRSFAGLVATVEPGHRLLDRLFALAFASAAPALADEAFAFIEADLDRLALGNLTGDDQSDTLQLVAALSSVIDEAGNDRLLRLVMAWNERRPGPSVDAPARFRRRAENRRRRVRLLTRLDGARLSPWARGIVEEERRAVPEPDRERERVRTLAGYVRSPMSTEAMARADDEQILELFRELPDGTERRNGQPFLSLVGGSQEASDALAELGKGQPNRVLALLDRFSPETHQVPVGTTLRILAGADTADPGRVLGALQAALDRGFGDAGFRREAAWALDRLALRVGGLDDPWIDRLVSWLEPAGPDPVPSWSEPAEAGANASPPTSVLLGDGGLRLIQGGVNATTLRAVTHGLLARPDPDYRQWLDRLETHLDRPEEDAVWIEISNDLDQLIGAEAGRAERFLSALLHGRPALRDSAEGARLVARLLGTISPTLVDEVLTAWKTSDWPLAPLALGEVTALRAARFDPASGVDVFLALGQGKRVHPDVLVGAANIAVEFWNDGDPGLRGWARRVLAPLATRPEPRIAQVCAEMFYRVEPWPAEADTRQLLRAFAGNPAVLRQVTDFHVDDRLGELVDDPLFHEPILDFVECLTHSMDQTLADHRTFGPLLARSLVPLVLHIHREGRFRVRTLTLFEALLDVVPDEAEEFLRSLS